MIPKNKTKKLEIGKSEKNKYLLIYKIYKKSFTILKSPRQPLCVMTYNNFRWRNVNHSHSGRRDNKG